MDNNEIIIEKLGSLRISRKIFGGKAYNLNILIQHGILVPAGICISYQLWEYLTEKGKNQVKRLPLNMKNIIMSFIQNNLGDVSMLIIRSSALFEDDIKYSFAGVFESCIVQNMKDDIEKGIIKVLNSSFSKRVQIYSKKFKLPFPIPMALLIQEAIAADFSGVIFTKDWGNKENIIIESVPSLGLPLVAGQTSPDRYYLSRSNLKLIKKDVNPIKEKVMKVKDNSVVAKENEISKQLPEEIIKQLGKLSLKIEQIFDIPQDIEWCLKGNQIYILQSRPITIFKEKKSRIEKQKQLLAEPKILKGIPGSPGVVEGIAQVVTKTFDFTLEKGRILVAPMTDPNMLPELIKASGIVTDRGGVISHAAIISREMGIPCVVGTGNATNIITSNDKIMVDGNKGLVWLSHTGEAKVRREEKISEHKTYRIYGQNVPIRTLAVRRVKPWIQEIWRFPWKGEYKGELEFIPPRPEIVATPLTQSIVMPAIESIPYILAVGDKELVTILYRGTIHVEYRYLKKIIDYLREKLTIELDLNFMRNYMQSIESSYRKLEKATNRFSDYIKNNRLDIKESLKYLFKWWEVHNNFFARTYLMQVMGDDIVWPFIKEQLMPKFGEDRTFKVINTLLKPIEESISINFLNDAFSLIKNLPEYYKELLTSNISDNNLIHILQNLPNYEIFFKNLVKFTEKWGWMRTRDFYFPPLDDPFRMLAFLRKNVFATQRNIPMDLKTNKQEYCALMQRLQKQISSELLELIKFGVFLNFHRNEHFYIWIKNTTEIIGYFLNIADIFIEKQIINEKKDIFFLFVWEIIKLLHNTKRFDSDQIKKYILSRKCHFAKGNNL